MSRKIHDLTLINLPSANTFLRVDGSRMVINSAGSEIDLTSEVTGVLPVPNGGTGLSSITADALVKGNGVGNLLVTGISVDASDNVTGVNDMVVNGNLDVKGTTTSTDSVVVNIGDRHILLNKDQTTVVNETGGITVVRSSTGTTDTVAGGAFTSATTVDTTGAATFSAGDLILITDADDVTNNGLFQVASHAANVLTIDPLGEDFVQTSFVTDATVIGDITQVNVSVLQSGTDGVFEVGQGSSAPVTFSDIVTDGSNTSFAGSTWYTDTATTVDATLTTLTTIPTTAGSTNFVTANVVGRNITDSTSAGFRYDRTFENTGGVLTQIIGNSNLKFNEDEPNMTLSIAASGTNILVQVTGAAAKTVNWKSTVMVLSV